MDQETRAKRAREVRDVLFGKAYSEGPRQERLPVEDEIQRTVGDFAFGEVWSRPGLEIKTRSLITIAMLAALYRTGRADVIHANITMGFENGQNEVPAQRRPQ